MSLQHIFESARKLGVPVIVTDVGGREPMVVLPLEQFEAMAGEAPGKPKPRPAVHDDGSKIPAIVAEDHVRPPIVEDIPSMGAPAVPPLPENDEMSLDERFYLEPLDDESGV